MKRYVLIILSIFLFGSLMAQTSKKEERKKRKAEKERKLEQQFNATENVLENRTFVLEADYLSDKYGQRVPVTSGLNFVMVDSSQATLQVGNVAGYGPNGVGGVTADGSVSDYDLDVNEKKKSFTISMNIMSSLGIYDVTMFVSASGNTTATISGLRGGKLNYHGDIVPLELSRVYKGQTTY
jgi:hypothetical protein